MHQQEINSTETEDVQPENPLRPFKIFMFYSIFGLAFALFGSWTGNKTLAPLMAATMLGWIVVTFMVLTSKQWQSIVLLFLTAPLVVYLFIEIVLWGEANEMIHR